MRPLWADLAIREGFQTGRSGWRSAGKYGSATAWTPLASAVGEPSHWGPVASGLHVRARRSPPRLVRTRVPGGLGCRRGPSKPACWLERRPPHRGSHVGAYESAARRIWNAPPVVADSEGRVIRFPVERRHPPRLLTLRELQELFGYSERWWRYRCAEGLPTRRWGKRLRFDPEEVRAWLDER